nr:MFS transporter [Pseudonocardia sp.]
MPEEPAPADDDITTTTGEESTRTPGPSRWMSPGVGGIGLASFLADVGHEVPTALLPSFVTSTLGAPAAALGLIEGISDGLAGAGRFVRGALADDPTRRRAIAVGGYTTTAVLSALIGTAGNVVQVGVLRGASWAARGMRVPARNALLADVVPAGAYGRAYGFERTMDNLGAIGGPLLALGLVAAFSVRTAILVSVVPGLLAAAAIVFAIRPILRLRSEGRITSAGIRDSPANALAWASTSSTESASACSTRWPSSWARVRPSRSGGGGGVEQDDRVLAHPLREPVHPGGGEVLSD